MVDGNQTACPTSPIDVPSSLRLGDNTSFVGSPEQTDDPERVLPTRPSSSVGDMNYQGPSLDYRRFSSPHLHSVGLDTTQSSSISSSFRRSQLPRERQWTLFGQVMENELRDSESRRVKKRLSRVSSESLGSHLSSSYTREDRESRVQSPVEGLPPSRDDVSEDDYDSDTSETATTPSRPPLVEPAPGWYFTRYFPTVTTLHRSIIKCVIAYFITSLFTFSPYLSGFVADITSDAEPGNTRPSPAGHMVATV
jgi:hypothetical protein